jgi:hypothetical protein
MTGGPGNGPRPNALINTHATFRWRHGLFSAFDFDQIAKLTQASGAALIVDNTFATPMLVRPLELGANLVVHSLTKYLAGHGDVMGGLIVSDEAHYDALRTLSRTYGPTLGPFEAYLAMRGIKTFPLRMERQCRNAVTVAAFLRQHANVVKVNFLNDPEHPDRATLLRLLPDGLHGAMISFELKDAGRPEVGQHRCRLGSDSIVQGDPANAGWSVRDVDQAIAIRLVKVVDGFGSSGDAQFAEPGCTADADLASLDGGGDAAASGF